MMIVLGELVAMVIEVIIDIVFCLLPPYKKDKK